MGGTLSASSPAPREEKRRASSLQKRRVGFKISFGPPQRKGGGGGSCAVQPVRKGKSPRYHALQHRGGEKKKGEKRGTPFFCIVEKTKRQRAGVLAPSANKGKGGKKKPKRRVACPTPYLMAPKKERKRPRDRPLSRRGEENFLSSSHRPQAEEMKKKKRQRLVHLARGGGKG